MPPGIATITIVRRELWSSYHAFNVNAYPNDLATIANSCSIRLALMLIQAEAIRHEVLRERQVFTAEINANLERISNSVISSGGVPVIANTAGIGYVGALYSLLTTTRSFLDVYAKLMGKLIGRQLSWSYKRAKVNNVEIAGGAIINWLRRSAPSSYSQAPLLADAIERHSHAWVNQMVAHRDSITHHSEISGFQHLSVPLMPMRPCFIESAIEDPLMPDGTSLEGFALAILENSKALIRETLVLLPNVDHSDLQLDRLLCP